MSINNYIVKIIIIFVYIIPYNAFAKTKMLERVMLLDCLGVDIDGIEIDGIENEDKAKGDSKGPKTEITTEINTGGPIKMIEKVDASTQTTITTRDRGTQVEKVDASTQTTTTIDQGTQTESPPASTPTTSLRKHARSRSDSSLPTNSTIKNLLNESTEDNTTPPSEDPTSSLHFLDDGDHADSKSEEPDSPLLLEEEIIDESDSEIIESELSESDVSSSNNNDLLETSSLNSMSTPQQIAQIQNNNQKTNAADQESINHTKEDNSNNNSNNNSKNNSAHGVSQAVRHVTQGVEQLINARIDTISPTISPTMSPAIASGDEEEKKNRDIGVWLNAIYGRGKRSSHKSSYKVSLSGIGVGIDKYITNSFLLGVSAQYIMPKVNVNNTQFAGDYFIVSSYFLKDFNKFFVNGSLFAGQGKIKEKGDVFKNRIYGVNFSSGYKFHLTDNLLISPIVSGKYIYSNTTNDDHLDLISGRIGCNIGYVINGDSVMLIPSVYYFIAGEKIIKNSNWCLVYAEEDKFLLGKKPLGYSIVGANILFKQEKSDIVFHVNYETGKGYKNYQFSFKYRVNL